jgi:hypothetical protein
MPYLSFENSYWSKDIVETVDSTVQVLARFLRADPECTSTPPCMRLPRGPERLRNRQQRNYRKQTMLHRHIRFHCQKIMNQERNTFNHYNGTPRNQCYRYWYGDSPCGTRHPRFTSTGATMSHCSRSHTAHQTKKRVERKKMQQSHTTL